MPENQLTIGDIVKQTGYPLHRIQYFLKALHIKPQCKIGPSRVFTAKDAEKIKTYIEKLDSRKQ
jgi:predicted transcriptional regulator